MAGLLDGVRARGAFLLRSVLEPPWSMRIEDEASLTLAAAVAGRAWLVPDDPATEPVALDPGDVAVIRGPGHYVVADQPATPPSVVIHPGQRCTTLDGRDLALARSLGVRTWGDADGTTVLLTGTYEGRSEVSRRLLDALPHVLVAPAHNADAALVDLLAREVGRGEPGQEVVLDRLLDLLLIAVIRDWFERSGTAPRWWQADADPLVGRALRLLYDDPAHPWTVAGLATAVGASRAAFARRFTELVGEPPIAFLTSWRLALAADLLGRPDSTIGAVAGQVGYGSPFALSTAFKRVYGISPHEHRAGLRALA
ncbi:AraC family transcriptional regulator [soil metagenome]